MTVKLQCLIQVFHTLQIWGAQFAEDKGVNDLVGTDGECATWGTGNGAYKFIDNKDVVSSHNATWRVSR